MPHPCPPPGLKETRTTSPQGRGQGPAASAGQQRGCRLPHSLTGDRAHHVCPFQTPASILPKHCSQPTQLPSGQHGLSELPLLGWARQSLVTCFWAPWNPPAPPSTHNACPLPKAEKERPVGRLALRTSKGLTSASQFSPKTSQEEKGQRGGQGRQGDTQTSFPGRGQGREPSGGQQYPPP